MTSEQAADIFHEKLCQFTDFVQLLSPSCEDVRAFRSLLDRAHSITGSVTITEYVGWYFYQFQDQILNQDTDFLLNFDFEPLIGQMEKNKAFSTYSTMARNLVAMMKETYQSLDTESNKTKFNLFVMQLLRTYMLFMKMSSRK